MAGPATSAGSPSSTAPACSTAAAGSGSARSASSSSRGCTWSPGSGSCCTGPGWGWAGHCGWTPPPSTSPTTSRSTRWPLPAARPSCWPPARTWRLGSWIQPGRYGNCGCCPACPTGRWARTCGCTTPSPTAPRRWPSSGRCWTRPPARPRQPRHRGRRRRPRPPVTCWPTTCAAAGPNSAAGGRALLIQTGRCARRGGPGRRLAIIRGRLEATKQIAHAHGATVNDVVLAAVAGGLRELLASRGEDTRGLVQRAMVTISRHQEQPGQARGNKPGWMMVPLPLGEPDPVRRLELIAAETAARKHQARPQAGSGIFRFAAGQRAWYRHFPRQRSVNLVVTNLAGPPVPLYLAGAPLLELFPMMPVMGNLTLVVAVLSYAGQLNLTATADRDACPDVELFVESVRSALGDLAPSALVPVS